MSRDPTIRRPRMASTQRWCRLTVIGPDGAVLASHEVGGVGDPDLATVDRLARLALGAGRAGGSVRLTAVCPALQELLDLTGLGRGHGPDVLEGRADGEGRFADGEGPFALRVEVEGQTELGEEMLRVEHRQEEVHPGDAAS